MISSVDVFYLSLGLGFLVLVGFSCYTLFQLAVILRNVREMSQDLADLKNTIKRGLLKFLMDGLFKKFKGGDD